MWKIIHCASLLFYLAASIFIHIIYTYIYTVCNGVSSASTQRACFRIHGLQFSWFAAGRNISAFFLFFQPSTYIIFYFVMVWRILTLRSILTLSSRNLEPVFLPLFCVFLCNRSLLFAFKIPHIMHALHRLKGF